MRTLEQALECDIVVFKSHTGRNWFVKVYPYIHKVKTIGERVRMYFWHKQRNNKKLIIG